MCFNTLGVFYIGTYSFQGHPKPNNKRVGGLETKKNIKNHGINENNILKRQHFQKNKLQNGCLQFFLKHFYQNIQFN